jgi:hypothetical protein
MPGWFVLLATALGGAVGVGLVVRAALRRRFPAPVPAVVASPMRAQAADLVGGGCPAALAARIAEPLWS